MLDSQSSKGKEIVKYEEDAIDIFANEFDIEVVLTDRTTAAKVDGIMIKDNILCGIVEVKCRNLTTEKLHGYGTWLVTKDKITTGIYLSKQFRVPFYGLLYSIPDGKLFVWQISDSEGNYTFNFKTKRTRTQKTINGGVAYRENAFLPVENILFEI